MSSFLVVFSPSPLIRGKFFFLGVSGSCKFILSSYPTHQLVFRSTLSFLFQPKVIGALSDYRLVYNYVLLLSVLDMVYCAHPQSHYAGQWVKDPTEHQFGVLQQHPCTKTGRLGIEFVGEKLRDALMCCSSNAILSCNIVYRQRSASDWEPELAGTDKLV